MNGSPELKQLIEGMFEPELYVDQDTNLQDWADQFNKYLSYSDLELRLTPKRATLCNRSGLIVEAERLEVLTDEFVHQQMGKIEDKLQKDDFDGAISSSRSLLEAVLNAVHVQCTGAELPKSGELRQDYKAVRTLLGLQDDEKDQPVKQVLNALNSIVDGVDTLSNRMGDRHRRRYTPERRHAKLVVDSTKTLIDFLLATYQVKIRTRNNESQDFVKRGS